MRLIFLLFLAVELVIGMPARAQLLEISAIGETTYPGNGIYSTILAGTSFIFTATFNLANASLLSSTSTSATYSDPTGTSSFGCDGFNFNGTAPQIQVTSNQGGIYGFEFSQFLTSGGYAVQLLSADSSVAPSTSLGSVHTSPMSDFANSLNISAFNDGKGDSIQATTTSFSVQIVSVPEPSTVTLFTISIPLLWMLCRCRLLRCRAA